MDSKSIRNKFLDFFKAKEHQIVSSAPLVNKDDPTLLFTNAGMNQFKDYFLGHKTAKSPRVADTQKCLRVSGKHNDLEEVGMDTYHHTLFEMLGNWSFGDYFKKEAIAWAWELLVHEYKLPADRLYVTVFGGDQGDGLPVDQEAYDHWKSIIEEDRILYGSKKDNFWEMGDTGPCGPCSEIHIDLRPEKEVNDLPGKALVNQDHPLVVEVWNLVFMEFNRLASGKLESLPAKHVDTGMGFERLCMAVQNKSSNYDTDVFTPLIAFIADHTGKVYGQDEKTSIAMRVIADHCRAIAFAITDGQLPSNTGAGYVIRRILRRGVRYAFTFLDIKEPFIYKLIPLLTEQFEEVFPEIKAQQDFVMKVIEQEEASFLRTLDNGLLAFNHSLVRLVKKDLEIIFSDQQMNYQVPANDPADAHFLFPEKNVGIILSFDKKESYKTLGSITYYTIPVDSIVKSPDLGGLFQLEPLQGVKFSFQSKLSGKDVFLLYDTHGFPPDLTHLIAKENRLKVDEKAFQEEMEKQKSRSKADAAKETGDWNIVVAAEETEFIGYDSLQAQSNILKYRGLKQKGKEVFQVVLDRTPFYAESGGQVGDTGTLTSGEEEIYVLDTKKENNLIVHFVNKLPQNRESTFTAKVNAGRRSLTMNNHTATHLLHAALRQVLGKHVEQKGSLVNDKLLRFDFSHFQKMTQQEISEVEKIVNGKIRENIALDEQRNVPIEQAKKMGAMALFGEKYGDFVRVIIFDHDYSVELCGGTHVPATGNIGWFKIISESSIAAGVRRIEAVTAQAAEDYMNGHQALVEELKELLKKPKDLKSAVSTLLEQKTTLEKELETLHNAQAQDLKKDLIAAAVADNGVKRIIGKVKLPGTDALKQLSFALKNEVEDLFMVLAADIGGKPQIAVAIADNIVKNKGLNAGNIVKDLAKEIQGGGGGQPFFATAGGKDVSGLDRVIEKAKNIL